MRKLLIITILLISYLECYSQIKFADGYFINNDGEKTKCYIKDLDWKNNPNKFEYKLTDSSEAVVATIDVVKEFGIQNSATYMRFKVEIDRSGHELDKLTTTVHPEFQEEVLFLKTLVDGPADLYVFVEGNIRRFFYRVGESKVKQLINKSYLTPNNRIGRNQGYKQQLLSDLNCGSQLMNDATNIGYTQKDLVKYFIEHNNCIDPTFVNPIEQQYDKELFNLSLKPGLNYSSTNIRHREMSTRDIDYGSRLGFRLGVEAEYILPFNKNKWAVFLEPTYRYFKADKKEGNLDLDINYQSVEIPLGLRHNFYLNDNSKIFVNGLYVIDLAFGSRIEFVPRTKMDDLILNPGRNVAFGAGYKYRDRYSVEMRYFTKRRLFEDTNYWASEHNNASIILGYRVF